MALLHKATLAPSKLELLSAYLPTVTAFGPAAQPEFTLIGAYRFDDPDGQVGIETHIVGSASGSTLHIPLTYRNEPLPGAEAALIDTIEHSVLGPRWVYDACVDPVYVRQLLDTMLSGATQVEQYFDEPDGDRTYREPTALATGSGTPGRTIPAVDAVTTGHDGSDTVISSGGLEIVVRHIVDTASAEGSDELSGTWSGIDVPVQLAYIR